MKLKKMFIYFIAVLGIASVLLFMTPPPKEYLFVNLILILWAILPNTVYWYLAKKNLNNNVSFIIALIIGFIFAYFNLIYIAESISPTSSTVGLIIIFIPLYQFGLLILGFILTLILKYIVRK